jgi:hypothetical protein
MANAIVRYVKDGLGIGLQFKTVRREHQARFSTMMKRIIQPERPNLTSDNGRKG